MSSIAAVSIIGVTGYTGMELLRLLDHSPVFDVVHAAAHTRHGKTIKFEIPSMYGKTGELTISSMDQAVPDNVELVFVALPHGAASDVVKNHISHGRKVVDLSADFRHLNLNHYQSAYGQAHAAPEILQQRVYGLTEYVRSELKDAQLVANPGCYPTSALLPLLPLLQQGAIHHEVVIDSKSGVSGAGRGNKNQLMYCEIEGGFSAYGLPKHRHNWEIDELALEFSSKPLEATFTPHLIPIKRGMLSTIYINGENSEKWHGVLEHHYQGEPFVRVLPEGQLPAVQHVVGSNRCDIGIQAISPNKAVIVSCIDNLLKGAAGQAVQNANVMYGIEETTHLPLNALWP